MVPVGRELADAVLDAFTRHRLVGIGESYGLQNHHDALQLLLTDLRLPEVVDDIVVEFGNARYQDTMDQFLAGQPVADADLRAVWRNTTQSPRQTWDAPVYEQFYRTVRVWRIADGTPVGESLGGHTAGVTAVAAGTCRTALRSSSAPTATARSGSGGPPTIPCSCRRWTYLNR